MPIAAASKTDSAGFLLLTSQKASSNNAQAQNTVLKCLAVSCDCASFQATVSNIRCCNHCHHSWLLHVSEFIPLLKSSPYASGAVSYGEPATPSAVFDLVFMVLYGAQAIPVQLKILLDRLLSFVDADTRLSLLDSFGWTMDDYARGYILQDRAGNKLLDWNMCSGYEEQLILPQFLRYTATRALVLNMMGIRQLPYMPRTISEELSALHSGQSDLASLTETYMREALKGCRPAGKVNGEGADSLSPAKYQDEAGAGGEPLRLDRKLSLPDQGMMERLLNAAGFKNGCTSPGGASSTSDSTLKTQASTEDPAPPPPLRRSGDGAEPGAGAGRRPSARQAAAVLNGSMEADEQGLLSVVAAAPSVSAETFPYSYGMSSSNLDICMQGNSLYYSKTLRNIRRAASRRFHPRNLSSLGTNPLTGKKRVQCRVCLKTFCDKGALKIHISAVHLREMHKCTIEGCNMMFTSRRSRNRHSANPNPKLHSSVLRRNSGPFLPRCHVVSPNDGLLTPVSSCPTDVCAESPTERCSSRKRKSDHPTKLEVPSPELEDKCDSIDAMMPKLCETELDATDATDASNVSCHNAGGSLDSLSNGSSAPSMSRSAGHSNDVLDSSLPFGGIKAWDFGRSSACTTYDGSDEGGDMNHAELLAFKIRELCNLRQSNVTVNDVHQTFGEAGDLGDQDRGSRNASNRMYEDGKLHPGRANCLGIKENSQSVVGTPAKSDDLTAPIKRVPNSSPATDSLPPSSNGIIMTRCKTASGATVEIPINEKNPRQCSACGKMFQNHFSVKTHYQNVHLKVMHGCTVRGCTAAFPSKRSRDRHSANKNLHRRLLNTGGSLVDQDINPSGQRTYSLSVRDDSQFGFLLNNCRSGRNAFLPPELVNPRASAALAAAGAAFCGALRNPTVSDEALLPPFPVPVLPPYLAGQLAAAGFQQDMMLINAQCRTSAASAACPQMDNVPHQKAHFSSDDRESSSNASVNSWVEENFHNGQSSS